MILVVVVHCIGSLACIRLVFFFVSTTCGAFVPFIFLFKTLVLLDHGQLRIVADVLRLYARVHLVLTLGSNGNEEAIEEGAEANLQ
jgi:hypothetical protein